MAEEKKSLSNEDRINRIIDSDKFHALPDDQKRRVVNLLEKNTGRTVDSRFSSTANKAPANDIAPRKMFELTKENFQNIARLASVVLPAKGGPVIAFLPEKQRVSLGGPTDKQMNLLGRAEVAAANAAAFGVPERISRAAGVEIRPEGTQEERLANAIGTTLGVAGGSARLVGKAGERLVPRVADETLGRTIKRGAIEGALFGVTDVIGNRSLSLREQALKGTLGGLLGATIPAGVAGINKTLEFGGNIIRGIAGITQKSINVVKKYGPERVFDLAKRNVQYVGEVIVPKLKHGIQRTINAGGKASRKMLQRLGLADDAVDRISQRGIDTVREVGRTKSLESVALNVNKGLEKMMKDSKAGFEKLLNKHPNLKVLPDRAFRTTRNILNRFGLLHPDGSVNVLKTKTVGDPAVRGIIKAYNKLLEFATQGPRGVKVTVPMTRGEYQLLNINLDAAVGSVPSTSRLVFEISNALTKDLTRVLPGRGAANRAFTLVKPFFDKFHGRLDVNTLNALTKPGVLKKSALKGLEKILSKQFKFIDDVLDINAARKLSKTVATQLDDGVLESTIFSIKRQGSKVAEDRVRSLAKGANVSNIVDDVEMHFAHLDFASQANAATPATTVRRGGAKVIFESMLKAYLKSPLFKLQGVVATGLEKGTRIGGPLGGVLGATAGRVVEGLQRAAQKKQAKKKKKK